MQFPTIHLNGTGADTLLAEYERALDALDDAYEAVSQITVHARDYYVQGNDAFRHAHDEQTARLRALDLVRYEITETIQHLRDQMDARKARR
jgi:hypothetical protein